MMLSYAKPFKDISREKAPSNKTPLITKRMNMDILVVSTSNQLKFLNKKKIKKIK